MRGGMFLPDGLVDQRAFEAHAIAPLVSAALRGLDRDTVWGAYHEIMRRTTSLSVEEVRRRVTQSQQQLSRQPECLAGLLPTDRHGAHGREWAFFQRRRGALD